MTRLALILSLALIAPLTPAVADDSSLDAMRDYMDFATPLEGIILPGQIDETVFQAATFIDARSAEEHATGTIPGARNIEWREVLTRIDEVPDSGLVVMFCNTGVRSTQAMFALRVAGRSNVVVMQSGLDGWLETAPYHP